MSEGNQSVPEEQAVIERALDLVREHWDNVQVFASRQNKDDDGVTERIKSGRGNYFARYGQVREWLIKAEKDMQIEAEKDFGD